MAQLFVIPGRLPGYNDLAKGHWATQKKVKIRGMKIVDAYARQAKIQPVKGRVSIRISCYEPNARRDFDNVLSGASKVILDALQNMGVLKGDGQKYVEYRPVPVMIDRKNPHVEVQIEEA